LEKTILSAHADPQEFKKFLTNAVCFISLGLGTASLGPILPFLADNVRVSIGQISFVFTAQNLGYLLGSVGGSWLYDHFKSHKLMAFSLGLMVVMGLLIPLMSWYYALLVVLLFFGLGLGTIDAGGNLNLMWLLQSRVGPFMNALHFSFGLGAFLSPIIISYVMAWSGGSLMWAMWALVILYLPGLIGLITFESPENIATKDHHGITTPVNYRMIIPIILLFFLSVGIQTGFGGWVFTYVSELSIADVSKAALMTSLFWGAMTLGRMIAIPFSKKVEPHLMLLISCILTVLTMGLILIWPLSSWMMWVGSAGLGLATATIFPTLMAFAEARMTMTGRITGLFFLGSGLGMMVLPMLLGQIFEYLGGYLMMLTLFALAALALVIMIFLNKNRFQEKVRDADA